MYLHFTKTGNGKPIVYLHGWGCDGNIFKPVAERNSDYANYLVDMAGFGESKDPPLNGWSVADYANDLKEMFETENIKNALIVGHSFGGRVAMVFCALYPQYVEKLLLVSPAGLRRFSFTRWFKVKKYRCTRFLHNAGIIKVPKTEGSADYKACSLQMKNTFVRVINQDLSLYAKRITRPTLIVNGSADTETTISHARRLNRMIKNSSLAEIDQ